MTIEQHIDELRAELRNAVDANERRQIEVELELARAEREVILAEQDGRVSAEPPFWRRFISMSLRLPAGSTGRAAARDFTPGRPRRLAPGTVSLYGSAGLFSLTSYFTPANPASRTARSPPIFSAAALHCASEKIGSPACKSRSAIADPSLPRSGRPPSSR